MPLAHSGWVIPWGLALSAAALAQSEGEPPPPSGARDCVVLADPAQRLACYDRLHGRNPRSPGPALAPVVALPAPAPVGTEPRPAGTSPEAPAPLVASACPARSARPLDEDWDLDLDAAGHPGCARSLSARPDRPTYLMPLSWTSRVNREPRSPSPQHQVTTPLDLLNTEAKFQLSFKTRLGQPLAGLPLTVWGGYTQSSRWQVYNGADSRPFRETNYEPELFVTWAMQGVTLPGGLGLRMGSLSLNHLSNGRALPYSRSWNRVILGLGLDSADQRWSVELRPWWRVPETQSADDNPDLADHYGRGELLVRRLWDERQSLTLQLRHSLRGGSRNRGSALLDWAFPLSARLSTSDLHGHLQLFSGYGESLVDYNLRQSRVGLGITLAGWR